MGSSCLSAVAGVLLGELVEQMVARDPAEIVKSYVHEGMTGLARDGVLHTRVRKAWCYSTVTDFARLRG